MTTPAKGTGTSPFGTGAYGYGSPAIAVVPGGSIHRDARGMQQNCLALLAPTTPGGQSYAVTPTSPKLSYQFDEFGRRVGAPDVVHVVTLALATVKTTSIDPDLGQSFGDIRKITDSFEQDMRGRVQDALSNAIAQKLIRLDSVTATPGNGAPAFTLVKMTDLATGRAFDASI